MPCRTESWSSQPPCCWSPHRAGPPSSGRPCCLLPAGSITTMSSGRWSPLGLEIDACPAEKTADRLATRKYNVIVVSTMSDAQRKAVDAFLAGGGGALVCNPEGAWHIKDWPATNQWLAARGARPRWEVLQDANKENLARDCMGCELSWTDRVSPPANRGIRGLLTVTAASTTGWEPPMSLDFSPAWTVVARGTATHKGVAEVRNDEQLQPWIPKQPLAGSPALMGIRSVGPGRLAVVGIRSHWLFTPPYNCPTAEAMLTAGAGGRPSDWLRLFANTVAWLAEPSLANGMGGMKTLKASARSTGDAVGGPAGGSMDETGPHARHAPGPGNDRAGRHLLRRGHSGRLRPGGQGRPPASSSSSWKTASKWTRAAGTGWSRSVPRPPTSSSRPCRA